MDKTELLNYFLDHHMSRQDVLFRLPLNITANTFWAELLDIRKSRAVFLPLHNASGAAYWYVLTDRMIRASQRLCEEALLSTEQYDPYRPVMTGAMVQEMFFTSYVEGASITFDDGIKFLSSRNYPENIQEQMLWNNRRAWEAMIRNLFRPIDEGFVRSLAFLLTDGMDNGSSEYRSWNNHPIAAMQGESYEVPVSSAVPDRMAELYRFLQDLDTHPLIKATAAHAFILAIRPFPEGNERLARMISAAVLLRGGYSYFRNISISSAIARENYQYYKSMKETLRAENGGDLTYFMEYYLELLVNALDERTRSNLVRQNQAIDAEKNMSGISLDKTADMTFPSEELPLNESPSAEEALIGDHAIYASSEENQSDRKVPVSLPEAEINPDFWSEVQRLETSKSETLRDMARLIRKWVKSGIMVFSREDLLSSFNGQQVKTILEKLRVYNLIIKTGSLPKFQYHFRTDCYLEKNPISSEKTVPQLAEQIEVSDDMTVEQILDLFSCAREQTRDWRIAAFLIKCRENGTEVFTTQDWSVFFGITSNVAKKDEQRAVGLGLIYEVGKSTGNRSAVYGICTERSTKVTFENTTDFQKKLITTIYLRFQNNSFYSTDCIGLLDMTINTVSYHLSGFADRGILSSKRIGTKNLYSCLVVPETNPECFDMDLLQAENETGADTNNHALLEAQESVAS